MGKIIASGAEADIIKKDKTVIKKRISKGYRLPLLDERLRRQRTRRETRILEKASKIIPVPKLLHSSEETKEIEMEFLDGKKLSESLDSIRNSEKLCQEIGKNIASLHDANIVHGDLTTSNMIFQDSKLYFIDFGLSFESNKLEDKAVDLHLIKQALEAKHFTNSDKFFSAVLKGYRSSKNAKAVLSRLAQVEKRGRYKNSY